MAEPARPDLPAGFGLGERAHLLARLVDSRLVTDDNMAPEWSKPLNRPIVPVEAPVGVVDF